MGLDNAIFCDTGTGKTFAYLLPILSKITEVINANQKNMDMNSTATSYNHYDCAIGLIIVPTADLAFQIVAAARSLIPPEMAHLCLSISAGVNLKRQMKLIRKKRPMILVGTPGRVIDMNRHSLIQLHRVHFLVFDEVDQLMTPAFLDDIKFIVSHTGIRLKKGRQTIIVSATIEPKILQILKKNI
jgi:superfamily II DNA/RNA helicase